ncbi:sensor domain-containing diguanylate cyclase [Thiorhodococcus minor]|uniref:Diguanylate cyclase n=1 Tax=Thiorhodococcus minor TaxID=57489 RepID=A0A6M0K3E5_9GAMM|nr:sensor domain-containing diguanylate cyclase [Thiorhodococcus minor]NEV63804.1 diguanylate cyclase [Thiorhodococcus minor]
MLLEGSHSSLFPTVNAIGTGVAVFSVEAGRQFELVTANELYAEVSELSVVEMVGRTLNEIFPRHIGREVGERLRECVVTQATVETEAVVERKDTQRWWRFIFAPLMAPGHAVRRVMHTCIEITDKKRLEYSLGISRKRFESVVEAAYDGIITVSRDYGINLVNDAACEVFEASREQLIGASLDTLVPHHYRSKHRGYFLGFGESSLSNRPMHARADVRGLRSDGSEFAAEVTIAKIRVGNDNEYMAVVRDISERAKLIEELKKAAVEDVLTGIHNRRYFEDALRQEVSRARRFEHPLSLAMFDVDDFKAINDVHGHAAGDQVLVRITKIVRDELREVDSLARWGGDEFVAILPETPVSEGERLFARIRASVSSGTAWADIGCRVAISVGLIGLEASDEGIETMLRRLDAAMYAAKCAKPKKA